MSSISCKQLGQEKINELLKRGILARLFRLGSTDTFLLFISGNNSFSVPRHVEAFNLVNEARFTTQQAESTILLAMSVAACGSFVLQSFRLSPFKAGFSSLSLFSLWNRLEFLKEGEKKALFPSSEILSSNKKKKKEEKKIVLTPVSPERILKYNLDESRN